ncbi:RHS repeat-associated core domain-containing protein, partial [Streptomyces sp. NPDC017940]|uniref:RHS repeat-associated core domain-containing protein n=1 Tax=Streptomyces sp. NPDC017940 TaxID=3365017 RepID=UPI00378D3667
PTGLYHFKARYYDPHMTRFTQPDPSGQEKNPYLYAEGDPVNKIDPNGTLPFGKIFKAVGAANTIDTVGRAWNAGLDGEWGKAAGIAFGGVVGAAVESTCIGAGTYLGGPTTGAAVTAPCMAAGEAAGSYAENKTVQAWS